MSINTSLVLSAVLALGAASYSDGAPAPVKPQVALPQFTNSIGMPFVKIPAGQFTMGSPANEPQRGFDDETQHKVKISRAFFMGVFPVTSDEWMAAVSGGTANRQAGGPPANNMTWDEAVEFCKKLSEKEGRRYRLPTEAEWEYACRAGTTTAYFFGAASQGNDYSWNWGNGGGPDRNPADKKPNPWGLYGLFGPALQWCSDWYGAYGKGAQTDPRGPDQAKAIKYPLPSAHPQGPGHIIRGIPFDSGPEKCRSAARAANPPDIRSIAVGFRVVLEDVTSGGSSKNIQGINSRD